MEIFVVRHTAVTAGRDTCYGQYNVPLSDTFKEEAAAIKKKLAYNFDAIFCSPLDRCVALGQELGYKNIQQNSLLKEYHFGTWENKKWADLPAAELDPWMLDFVNMPAPNGENLLQLNARVEQCLNELLEKDYQKVLLLTHAGPMRCIWRYVLDMPLANIFKIPVAFGAILHIQVEKDKNYNRIISF